MKKNGCIRRSLRAVLKGLGMPERLAQRNRKKGSDYTFLNALAAEAPQRDEESGEATVKAKPAKVPTDLVEIVVAALQTEGLEGDKAAIKEFEASCADEIRRILVESDLTVRGALLRAAAERFAMDKRPRATNSYKRKGIFPIG